MTETVIPTVLWWIVAVDIPLLTCFIVTAMRFKRDMDIAITSLREGLTHYKLEVAQTYASIQQLKDLEGRLVAHLLRIETKLENSLFPSTRDKG